MRVALDVQLVDHRVGQRCVGPPLAAPIELAGVDDRARHERSRVDVVVATERLVPTAPHRRSRGRRDPATVSPGYNAHPNPGHTGHEPGIRSATPGRHPVDAATPDEALRRVPTARRVSAPPSSNRHSSTRLGDAREHRERDAGRVARARRAPGVIAALPVGSTDGSRGRQPARSTRSGAKRRARGRRRRGSTRGRAGPPASSGPAPGDRRTPARTAVVPGQEDRQQPPAQVRGDPGERALRRPSRAGTRPSTRRRSARA